MNHDKLLSLTSRSISWHSVINIQYAFIRLPNSNQINSRMIPGKHRRERGMHGNHGVPIVCWHRWAFVLRDRYMDIDLIYSLSYIFVFGIYYAHSLKDLIQDICKMNAVSVCSILICEWEDLCIHSLSDDWGASWWNTGQYNNHFPSIFDIMRTNSWMILTFSMPCVLRKCSLKSKLNIYPDIAYLQH